MTDPSRQYVTGSILLDTSHHVQTMEWSDPPQKWHEMRYDSEKERSEKNMVWHGQVFQDLKKIATIKETLWGQIIAPSAEALGGNQRTGRWLIPAALLDACLQACSTLTYIKSKTYHLPVGFESLRLLKELTPEMNCTVQVQLLEEGESQTFFNFAVFNEKQDVMLLAHRYRAAIISKAGEAAG